MFSGKEWVRVGRFHGGWRVWLPTNVSNVSMIISWFHLRRQLWFYHPPCECQVPGSASTGCFMVPVTNTASVPMIRTQSGTQMVEKGSKSTSFGSWYSGLRLAMASPSLEVSHYDSEIWFDRCWRRSQTYSIIPHHFYWVEAISGHGAFPKSLSWTHTNILKQTFRFFLSCPFPVVWSSFLEVPRKGEW